MRTYWVLDYFYYVGKRKIRKQVNTHLGTVEAHNMQEAFEKAETIFGVQRDTLKLHFVSGWSKEQVLKTPIGQQYINYPTTLNHIGLPDAHSNSF